MQRLKEKDDEWKRARASLNKGWKEELERNYEKSLDHRSFYFKQTDKRALTTKTIVASVKALAEEAAKKGAPPVVEVRVSTRQSKQLHDLFGRSTCADTSLVCCVVCPWWLVVVAV